ncbi:MAG: ABC transporter permease [Bacteroidetes bacterium]|nr:ABC transporter permease [Bacteroidota bacterium]MBL6943385.1 ABC transporter permease [Bacteroidales bacterium]
MLGNYFKIGTRVLLRQKSYALLNIIGLAIGIAVFTFIFLYIQSEIRYDRQWSDYKNIYRVTSEYNVDGKIEKIALTPFRLAEDFRKEFPEVVSSTNMFFTDPSDINDISSVTYEGEVFEIPDITLSEQNFFKIFDYPFLEGNPDSMLSEPNTMVISSEISQEIFGDESAIGKKLSTVVREYTVVGVFEKKCWPSHHNFDAIVSESSLDTAGLVRLKKDWYWLICYTYVKLNDTVNIEDFAFKFNGYAEKGRLESSKEDNMEIEGYFINKFEQVSNVHFNTQLQYDSPSNVDVTFLYIFGIIAAFILLTASINYINLATARSLRRAKEIGIRKVIGATKSQLVFQYISESVILTFFSFILAMSVVEFLMPKFNQLVGKELTLVGSIFSGEGIIFGIILFIMIFILALIGGSFPAFVLTSFNPASVIKGNYFISGKFGRQHFSAGLLRRFLVTVQYVVSIGIIISTFIVYAQMDFLKSHDLGFEEENIIVINTPHDTTFKHRISNFLTALGEDNSILEVSSALNVPGYTGGKMLFYVGDTSKQNIQALNYYGVGNNYFELLRAPLLKGRHFTNSPSEDTTRNFIINEAADDFLKLDNAVGTSLNLAYEDNLDRGKIIGVVKNFNFSSLHEDVEPLVFILDSKKARYVLVKFEDGKKDNAISHIRKVWEETNKGSFLHYTLLETKLENLYKGDKKMLSLFIYFSVFVIFISSLGLYGLSSFLIQQRTKEIGIRRILGGSEIQIMIMLAKVYLRVVMIAGLIASVIVYFLMTSWLNTFAYHITINGWYFVAGILITFLIATTTVLIRSFKVVHESPSVSLNYSG